MHCFIMRVNRLRISNWLLPTLTSSLFVLMAAQVQAAGERPQPKSGRNRTYQGAL